MKPKFSICIIARNEEKTLPRLVESLKEYCDRGGKIYILDTGSSDKTVTIAKKLKCSVTEVGDKFMLPAGNWMGINQKFVAGGEKKIISRGDRFFNFSAARNACAGLARADIIFWHDADEVAAKMDIDKINALIDEGFTQFEYNFVFAFDAFGNEAIKFIQSKAYDRRVKEWQGCVHELVVNKPGKESKKIFLDESIYKLVHYQNHESGRHNYLVGLAVDTFNNPKADRQSHYFARELMYSGRYHSAIKEFKRHITLGGWAQERAQSAIFIGDCYSYLNQGDLQLEWYNKAFSMDPTRREALLKIARVYQFRKDLLAAISYAKAALEIPYNDFYANAMADYREAPHAILYYCYGWLGNIPAAREHILKCLEYQPYNPEFLDHTKYYFEYPDNGIEGWMKFPELQWLYETAKKYNNILEGGSWKGRSTHALCSGCKGTVTSVDTWLGSDDVRDSTNILAKREDVFQAFQNVTRQFTNLKINRKRSLDAAKDYPDKSFDMIFIDMGHTKEDVRADLGAWLPKVKDDGIICGHDYLPDVWMGVIEAVDEVFGKPDGVCETIWYVDLAKRKKPEQQQKQLIPKKIFTAWLSDAGVPENIKKIIETQKIQGYEHHVITLENCPKRIPYVNDAIKAKKWVKAVDYLKMHYLSKHGGIFLDADVEILPDKNFDAMLGNAMFAAKEENGFIGYSVVGSMKGNLLAYRYLNLVEKEFKGDDDLFFESSMEVFTHLALSGDYNIKLYEPEYFFPYNHQTGIINVTARTIAFHHFFKSWNNDTDLLPAVSIIIPQLGRPEGLEKCLRSIDALYYPKHLIEIIIIKGAKMSVPVKMKKGLARSTGEIICYAANDMEFTPASLYNAVKLSKDYGLVAFNSGKVLPDQGNICEHFIITRKLIQKIGGEIFDTRLHHVGVDNLLWAKAKKLKQAARCEEAVVVHHHFSVTGVMDDVYKKGWSGVDKDRVLLEELINE